MTASGSGLDPNAANDVVKFGSNRAAVTNASPTQLTIVVPPGQPPGPTTVTVTVNGVPAGTLKFITIASTKIAGVAVSAAAGCLLVPPLKAGDNCNDGADLNSTNCVSDPAHLGAPLGGRSANVYGDRGEFFQFATDLLIPGRPGAADAVQLSVERQYRAAGANNGPLGMKWNHNHFESLQLEPNGSVLHSNGLDRNDVYNVNNQGAFVTPPEVYTQLTKNSNGTYDLRYRDHTVKHFDSSGKLLSTTDRNGNALTYSYDAQNRLQYLTDTLGRMLTYAYNASNQLTSITDWAGRKVSYSYDGNGNLASVTSPAVTGTPNGNDFPSGKTTRYTYDANHMLLTVTRPNEVAAGGPAVLTITYDSSGRVSTVAYGGINASTIPAGGTYAYTYTPLNAGVTSDDPNLPVMRTQQTDPNGNVTQYDYTRVGYPVAIREYTRGIRPGDPAVYVTTMTYNADGRITQKALPAGNSVQFQYDDGNPDRLQQANLLSQTTLPDATRGGDQAFITTTYTYEPVFNHVATMTEARGNDPSYIPQNGGAQSAVRYMTTYTYDASGNLIKAVEPTVTLPGGATQAVETDYTYNSFGQLSTTTDPEGNVTQYQYCAATVLVCTASAPNGGGYLQSKILDAASSPRRTESTPPLQILTQLTYDQLGNIITSTDGRGNTTHLTVNQLNQVVETQSAAPYGYITYIYYDANDNVVRRDVQNQIPVTPDDKPTFVSASDFASTTGTPPFFTYLYTYDILDHLVTDNEDATGSNPARVVTQYRYDPNRNRIELTLPAGNITTYQYDERNLRYKITQGFGTSDASTTTTNYDPNRNPVTLINGRGFTTTLRYDGFDRQTGVTDPVGGQTMSHFDPVSNNVSTLVYGQPGGASPTNNSGAGNVLLRSETFEYDELSRKYQGDEQPINGASFIASGVASSRPPSVTAGPLNPPAISTRTIFDRNGRVVQQIDDDGSIYSTTYDGLNRSVQEADGVGNTIQYVYDANNNVIETVESDVSQVTGVPSEALTTQFAYDTLNRLTIETDNCSNTRRWVYDSRNDATNDTDAKGDASPGCPGTVNGHGNSTVYTYDGLSRILQVSEDLRDNGLGSGTVNGHITVGYTYDGNGRLTTLTDSDSNVYQYVYDNLDRAKNETYPDGTKKQYIYDPDSNVMSIADNNGTTWTNIYDNADRLTQTSIVPGAGVGGTTTNTYQYDGVHRKTLLTDNNDPADPSSASVVSMVYDSLNRVVEEMQNGLAVDSGWTAQSLRTNLIYPNDRRIDTTYDLLQRTRTIQDHGVAANIAQYSYIGQGRVLLRNYQNGTRLTYLNSAGNADAGYDPLRRTIARNDLTSTNSLIVGFNYAYDREYNKNSEGKAHSPNQSETYSYDSAYRLAQWQRGPLSGPAAHTEQWKLDPAGNWLGDTVDGIAGARTVNNLNEYTSVNGAPLAYDKNGNLISGAVAYKWDYRNRLRQVCSITSVGATCDSAGSQSVATYSYDALDRRTRKIVANSDALNGTTNFYYDGWASIEERDGSNNVTQQYVNGINLDEPLTLDNAQGRLFYHQNELGSIAALTNASGAVVEGYQYGAYGQQTVLQPDFTTTLGSGLTSSVGNPFMFTGQRYDPESGLMYFKNRYYSTQLGRFISRDPVELMDTDNLYTYVENRPTAWIDPLGLCILRKNGKEVPGGCSTIWFYNRANLTKEERDAAGVSACSDDKSGLTCRGNCGQNKLCDYASAQGAKPPGGVAPLSTDISNTRPRQNLLQVLAGAVLDRVTGKQWWETRCCCTCADPPAANNPQNAAPQAGRGGGGAGNPAGGGRGQQGGGGGNPGGGNGGGRGGPQGNGGGNGNGAGGGGRGAQNGGNGALAGRGGNGNLGGAPAGRGGAGNGSGGGAAAGRGGNINITINLGVNVGIANGNIGNFNGGAGNTSNNPSNTVILINRTGHAPPLPGGGRGSRDGRGGRGQ